MVGCILSTVATDALVHQAISVHSAQLIFLVLDQFHNEKKNSYEVQY